MNWLDELKSQINIVDVVRRYVKIDKIIGDKCIIKCPFHDDKTPSLHIGTNNLFYCFGCHVGGDAIKFVQKIENISFIDAAHKIAAIYNFKIPERSGSQHKVVQYFTVMNQLVNWCQNNIQTNLLAIDYLKRRGLTDIIINEFTIGWMPDLNKIQLFCRNNQITDQDLREIGLQPNIMYMMQNRIIFPIYKQRTVIGLSGRYIEAKDNQPKYINTAETQYFKKKDTLYCCPDINNKFSKHHERIYLVEGYIDVCMMHSNGLYAAASMGTACSAQHLSMLLERGDEIRVLLDGDLAGRKAASRLACDALDVVDAGKAITFVELPNNMDPADCIQKKIQISNIPALTLPEKIWHDWNPRAHLNPEHMVGKYKEVLSMANKIKDKDLRQLYRKTWMDLWRKKPSADKSMKPSVSTCSNNAIQSKQIFIMLGILCHCPELIEHVYDYLVYLPLQNNDLYIQTILLQYYDRQHSSSNNIVPEPIPEDVLNEFSFDKLNSIAPFIKKNTPLPELTRIWLEVFDFFVKILSNEGN